MASGRMRRSETNSCGRFQLETCRAGNSQKSATDTMKAVPERDPPGLKRELMELNTSERRTTWTHVEQLKVGIRK